MTFNLTSLRASHITLYDIFMFAALVSYTHTIRMCTVNLWKPLIWKWNDLTQLVLRWIISTNYFIIEIPFHLNADSARKFIDCTAARAALRSCEKKIVSNCRQWRNRKENVPENLETLFQNSEERKKIMIESLLEDISERFFGPFFVGLFWQQQNKLFIFIRACDSRYFIPIAVAISLNENLLSSSARVFLHLSLPLSLSDARNAFNLHFLLSIGPEVSRPHWSKTILYE